MGNLTDHFAGGGGGSNILEELIGVCDGGSATVSSGTYTFPNVTGITALSTTNTTIPGIYELARPILTIKAYK